MYAPLIQKPWNETSNGQYKPDTQYPFIGIHCAFPLVEREAV